MIHTENKRSNVKVTILKLHFKMRLFIILRQNKDVRFLIGKLKHLFLCFCPLNASTLHSHVNERNHVFLKESLIISAHCKILIILPPQSKLRDQTPVKNRATRWYDSEKIKHEAQLCFLAAADSRNWISVFKVSSWLKSAPSSWCIKLPEYRGSASTAEQRKQTFRPKLNRKRFNQTASSKEKIRAEGLRFDLRVLRGFQWRGKSRNYRNVQVLLKKKSKTFKTRDERKGPSWQRKTQINYRQLATGWMSAATLVCFHGDVGGGAQLCVIILAGSDVVGGLGGGGGACVGRRQSGFSDLVLSMVEQNVGGVCLRDTRHTRTTSSLISHRFTLTENNWDTLRL